MEVYVKISSISIFSLFFWFSNMILSDALILPVSQLQTHDDVTNRVTHRIFNTDLLYSCAHFVVKIDEKSSHNGGFYYDLIMIRVSGYFLGHPVYVRIYEEPKRSEVLSQRQ